MKRNPAFLIGLVLGLVLIIMGFAYSNSAMWILGVIILGIGLAGKITQKK